MPKLVRFLVWHALIGLLIAIAAVAGLLYFDAFGIRTLMAGSPDGFLALFALVFMMALTCSSVQMGAAIMLLDEDGGDGEGGKRARASGEPTFFESRNPKAVRATAG